jgi:hypothetical protein
MRSPSPFAPRIMVRGLLACRNYPIVYLNMPKSACTTCKNLLYRIDTGDDYPNPLGIHGDVEFLLRSRGKDQKAFSAAVSNRKIAFTFVREPFSRCYSAFNEKIHFQSKHSFRQERNIVAGAFGGDFESDVSLRERHSENFAAFLRFVIANTAGQTDGIPPNPHRLDQATMLDNYREVCSIDLVGRVEQFDAGMRYVLNAGGYKGDVDLSVRFNEGPKAPFKLSEIMTDEIHAMLHQLYDGDLLRFGYRCSLCGEPSAKRRLSKVRDVAVG